MTENDLVAPQLRQSSMALAQPMLNWFAPTITLAKPRNRQACFREI